MGVQRQVVGEEVDAVFHQPANALAQPAGESPVLAAPEQAVVDQQGVGSGVHCGLDEGQAGRDPGAQAVHLGAALDLQTVRTIILEQFGSEQVLQAGLKFLTVGHGPILPRRHPSFPR